jgi:hypothetical protein
VTGPSNRSRDWTSYTPTGLVRTGAAHPRPGGCVVGRAPSGKFFFVFLTQFFFFSVYIFSFFKKKKYFLKKLEAFLYF